jgi:putative two-component system response regulator
MFGRSVSPAPEAWAPARSVLIVDDDPGVRGVMKRWLEAGGYLVATASSAEEALERLEASPPAVALCDIRMPGHDGLWLAERIRQQFPDTAIIMATGVQNDGPDADSLDEGVIDYLTKPFGRDRLKDAVLRGVEWHHSASDARTWRQTLEEEMELRRARLTAAVTALKVDSDDTLDATLAMVMVNDPGAHSHARRVAELAVSIAARLGQDDAEQAIVRHAGYLHDIGKLAIPEAILRKPAPLTAEEQSLIRLHPAIGADLLANLPYLQPAAALVRDVHERMDGRGYPRGRSADEIPLGARIVSVSDAYDAMTHARVYRDAISQANALLELDRCRDSQFDRAVVAALREVLS